MTDHTHISNEMQAAHEKMIEGWRTHTKTIDRLIGNIPAACKMLLEEGYVNLAGQLERDQRNLVHWQEHGSPRLEWPATKESGRRARSVQLNATCPYCKANMLDALQETAHDWASDEPPATRTIECPNCEKEIKFYLAWSATLYWAKPIVEEPT